MKKPLKLILITLLAALAWSCAEQESSMPKEVTFSVNVSAAANGRVSDLPSGTALLLSIKKSSGEVVFSNQRITLLKVGAKYITEPIALHAGDYAITDFMLVDADNEVLYATPLAGSPLAGSVSHPLPYSFTVSADVAATLDVEVIAAGELEPEDFGYASFGIQVNSVNSFKLSVFIPGDNGLELTDAQAFIMSGYDTLQLIDLDAKVNTIPFLQDTTQTYYLVVLKPGYTRYWKKIKYNELKNELAGQPLDVTLEPAITLWLWSTQFMGYYMRINYWGTLGKSIYYHLGEPTYGSYGKITFDLFQDNTIENWYEVPGHYFITIKGDIDQVTTLNHSSAVSAIDVQHATNLEGIGMPPGSDIEMLDLTHNHKLQTIGAGDLGRLTDVRVSPDNMLNYVQVSNTRLTSESLTELINNTYGSAVSHNTHNGTFRFEGSTLGTPSTEAIGKLQTLRDTYGWTIAPSL